MEDQREIFPYERIQQSSSFMNFKKLRNKHWKPRHFFALYLGCIFANPGFSASLDQETTLHATANLLPVQGLNIGNYLPVPYKLDLTTYAIQIEAESMDLDTYEVEINDIASGGNLVSLLNAPAGSQGSMSTTFNGATDDYFVVIYYLDENDGFAQLSVEVDGNSISNLILSQDFGEDLAERNAFTAVRLGPIKIERGNSITIQGTKDNGENARVDMIQLIPKDDLFQSETAQLGGDTSFKNNQPGFTGSGFVRLGNDFNVIGGLSSISKSPINSRLAVGDNQRIARQSDTSNLIYHLGSNSVTWTVNAAKSSEYALEFRYAFNAVSNLSRPLNVFINNELVKENIPFHGTELPHRWQTEIMIATLQEGANAIKIVTTGSGGVDIDYLAATPINYLTAKGDVSPLSDPYFPEYGDPGYLSSYYGLVDPQGERETLNEWLEVNDFNQFPYLVKSAEYINANDLGFGREMHCLDNGRSSCYVRNFLDPEGTSNFAATVTMERMNGTNGSFVAFFVYDAAGNRINQIALDSEGPKSVPESCYACHGGSRHGSGFYGGNYLPFDIDALKDWPGHPTRQQQLDDFKALNYVVWKDAKYLADNENLVSLIEGWYGEAPFYQTAEYDADRLPEQSWHADPNNLVSPANATNAAAVNDFLYNDVYGKYCRLCHVAQDLDWQDANAGDFAMAAYNHICTPENNQPRMPHAEVTFNKFFFDKIYTADDAKPHFEIDFILGNQTIFESTGKSLATVNTGKITGIHPELAGQLVVRPAKQSAKEMLCETLAISFPTGSVAAGETKFNSTCQGCHRVADAVNINDYDKPDLRCRGAWLRQDLGTITSQMSFLPPLSLTDIANLRSYFNSFDNCN